jgi:hypothetical protein
LGSCTRCLCQFLHCNAMKCHHGILTLETHQLVVSLIRLSCQKNTWIMCRGMVSQSFINQTSCESTARATVAIIMMICGGTKVYHSRIESCPFLTYTLFGSLDDTYIKLADEALESVSITAEPGTFFIYFLPVCALSHLQYNSQC